MGRVVGVEVLSGALKLAVIRQVLCGIFLCLLAACNTIPYAGPDLPTTDNQTLLRYARVIPLTPATVTRFEAAPAPSTPSLARRHSIVPAALIAPGDSVNVQIYESTNQGLFASAATGGTKFGPLYVGPKGLLDVPFAHRLKAAGLTLDQLAREIKKQVSAISVSPEVVVTFKSDQSNTVTVSGDVRAPGRYSLLDGLRTALDAINRAGGLGINRAGTSRVGAYQVDVVLRRHGIVRRQSLWAVMNGGDFPLRRGDDITLVDTPRTFVGLGAITKSGEYPLPEPKTNLLQALGIMGGLIDLQANRAGIVIYRAATSASKQIGKGSDGPIRLTSAHAAAASPVDPAGKRRTQSMPIFFTFNFSQPTSLMVAQKFAIHPGDVVYVSNAPTVDLGKFLNFIARGVGLGTGNLIVGP